MHLDFQCMYACIEGQISYNYNYYIKVAIFNIALYVEDGGNAF